MPRPFRFSLTATGVNDPGEFTELCRRAEGLGYSTVSMADHLDSQLAPLLALTAAAQATSTLRVLSLVLANDYRHPAVLAKEVTTLDQLSGGRLEFGIGAGWMASDYEQAGLPYDRPGVRIERLAEAVEILKASWTGEPVDFDGTYYRIDGLVNSPGPAQAGGPPLMLAGGARRMLTYAGEEADIVGVNAALTAGVIDERVGPSATAAATDEKIEWIRSGAGDRFDEIELQTRVHVAHVGDGVDDFAEAMAGALGLTREQALATPHAIICGSTAEAVETLQRWRERWGISYIGLSSDAIDAMAPVVADLAGT